MNTNTKKNKFAMGWLIVVGCMLIQAIPFGVAANIQPQFVSYVVEGEGFSLSGFSLIFTIGTVISAIASPFIGYLYSKVNAKLIFLVGCILSGAGFLALGFVHELWQFYLLAGVSQVGTAAISAIGVPLLVNAWFSEEVKGKAMGIAFSGGSIGNIFLQQLVAYSLSTQGHSNSYIIFGILSLVVGIPIALLMVRMPKNASEIVKGKDTGVQKAEKAEKPKASTESVEWGYTLNEVKKNKFFWLFAVGFIFLGIYISALAVQFPAYIKVELGQSAQFVGFVGSTFAVFSLFGNIFGGYLFDKLGTTKTLFIAFGLAAASCGSLILATNMPELSFLFAATKGLSVFAYMIGPAYLTGAFFGKKEFGAILGIANLIFAVGFAAGSSVFGLIVDSVGYFPAWSAMLVCIVIAYGILIVVAMNMKKINAKRIEELKAKAQSENEIIS